MAKALISFLQNKKLYFFGNELFYLTGRKDWENRFNDVKTGVTIPVKRKILHQRVFPLDLIFILGTRSNRIARNQGKRVCILGKFLGCRSC